ncbi:uncharacterized protein A1O9_06505 [Exophiala aquamarina CBS 119918]|uniref:Uncharacterized protein n=1 Tax=Exophiala aquamarina CBS 119918 TaxID=1182545 RepID=A0A072PEN2_9EURO|nr:uncharacterized protein A1O9_06505 [Exophiala aquamarina CBS 119918]KEF58579.1 hypothetical protein A1O9_06505 [Exophiala aquamarina CBS 119918]
MTDPLSIAASVTGFVSLSLQVTESLYKYYESYKHRRDELAQMAQRLHAVCQNLKLLEGIVAARKWPPGEQDILQRVDSSISDWKGIIQDLQEQLDKFENEPQATLKETIRVAGRSAAYPFRQRTLIKLAVDVDALQKSLCMTLQLLQVKDYAILGNDLEDIKNILKIAQAHNVTNGVNIWLKSPDVSVDYNSASEKRHSQTAIQHTWRYAQSQPECAIAYFFYTFQDKSKQDASALLRAILLQLCHQVTGFEAELTRLASNYTNGPPPPQVLVEYLHSAIARKQHVYLLVDALDEVPQSARGGDVLPTIQTIRDWKLPGLHLLVTSRDVVDIRQSLQATGEAAINLRNDSVNKDISQYVSDILKFDPQLSRWGEHCETIREHLSLKADGG